LPPQIVGCIGPCASAAALRRALLRPFGNGARLERINWLGNTASRAIREAFGIMVNYLYDHDSIEDKL
jgi:hypothetical protein